MKDDKWLQSVATEFNLPMTAYLTPLVDHHSENPRFQIRWFSPVSEFALCGHATLAASHYIFQAGLVKSNSNTIEFSSLYGILFAKKVSANDGFYIELDFPVVPVLDFNDLDVSAISEILNGATVVDAVKKNALEDIIVVLGSGEEVADLEPWFDKIKEAPGRAIIVTARAPNGSGFDFYSRVFAPKYGINETGSAHCALVTYWHEKMGKCDFVAYQVCSLFF
ncbi:putative phenazine biosynthesis PhzF protein [Helianthus annuus]|nr:putative phenazine biosynthesis PhzF protein [Helianthus annuus]KAJ0781896.1 putative phenazine biosynthesis PhzF protein [Helianthus annuus]